MAHAGLYRRRGLAGRIYTDPSVRRLGKSTGQFRMNVDERWASFSGLSAHHCRPRARPPAPACFVVVKALGRAVGWRPLRSRAAK